MTTISALEFLEATVAWARERDGGFRYYWPLKGGWEGWIQADLSGYLLSIDSTLEILREQPIFINPQSRVDLLLNTAQDTDDQIPSKSKRNPS